MTDPRATRDVSTGNVRTWTRRRLEICLGLQAVVVEAGEPPLTPGQWGVLGRSMTAFPSDEHAPWPELDHPDLPELVADTARHGAAGSPGGSRGDRITDGLLDRWVAMVLPVAHSRKLAGLRDDMHWADREHREAVERHADPDELKRLSRRSTAAYEAYRAGLDARDEALRDIPATGPADRAEALRELEEERAALAGYRADPDPGGVLRELMPDGEFEAHRLDRTAEFERRIFALEDRLGIWSQEREDAAMAATPPRSAAQSRRHHPAEWAAFDERQRQRQPGGYPS
jgi:hypothetical protein